MALRSTPQLLHEFAFFQKRTIPQWEGKAAKQHELFFNRRTGGNREATWKAALDNKIHKAYTEKVGRDWKLSAEPRRLRITGLAPCICHFCSRSISEAFLFLDAHGGPGKGHQIYHALCPDCDVDYYCDNLSSWALPHVEPAWLLGRLSNNDLDDLNRKFEHYKALGPKWRRFVARSRVGDEMWRFRSPQHDHTAIATLRGRKAIRIFSTFGNL